jgi:hypothetical protein
MSSAATDFADIDAAIAKGEWWMTLFDALSDAGMKQARALKLDSGVGLARVVQVFCRLAGAVCLAIVAAMRLDEILRGLADLRRLAPEAIAAAKARARAKAEEAAAARARARDKARAKREALKATACERAADVAHGETQDRETLDRKETALRDRDPAIEALDRRLTVDPAGVDFDALPLRGTVERICAALGVTPDWSRWEAGDWTMSGSPDSVHVDVQRQDRARPPTDQSHSPPPSPPKPSGPRTSASANRLAAISASPTIPGFTPRRTDTAIALALAFHAGPNAPSWPPLE